MRNPARSRVDPVAAFKAAWRDGTLIYSILFLLLGNWYIQALTYPFGPHQAVYALQILACGSLGLAVANFLSDPAASVRGIRENPALLVFLGYIVLSTVFLTNWDQPLPHGLYVLILLVSLASIISSRPVPEAVYRPLFPIIMALVFLYFILVALSLSPQPGNRLFRLEFSILGRQNPNNIADTIMPLVAALLVFDHIDTKPIWRFARLATLFMITWITTLCMSLAVSMGLLFGMAILLYFRRDRTIALGILISLLGILAGYATVYLLSPDGATKPLTGGVRLRIWGQYLQLFFANPVFGHGFMNVLTVETLSLRGEMRTYGSAHGMLVHLLIQGGLVGLALFLAVATEGYFKLKQIVREKLLFPAVYLAIASGAFLTQKGALLNWPPSTQMIAAAPFLVIVASWVHANRWSEHNVSEQPKGQ